MPSFPADDGRVQKNPSKVSLTRMEPRARVFGWRCNGLDTLAGANKRHRSIPDRRHRHAARASPRGLWAIPSKSEACWVG